MKLKNKETGEIGKIAKTKTDDEEIEIITDTKVYLYKSLSEVCQHWEDYEEPKEYWAIDCFSPDGELVSQFGRCSERIIENRKQIGNYFETKEEAEKAVEKLKAWKRLKDKGYKPVSATFNDDRLVVSMTYDFHIDPISLQTRKDLDLLFEDE